METRLENPLLENAKRIFDVACADAGDTADSEAQDFALLIRPDGGIHFVMNSAFSLEAAAIHAGARKAFRVTRSRDGVRVEGRSNSGSCILEKRNPCRRLLPDQPLYWMSSPLLTAGSAS